MTANNIYGYVRSQATGRGIEGLDMYIFAKHTAGGEPFSFMGFATTTGADGSFQFVFDDATLSGFFSSDELIQVAFQVRVMGGPVLLEPAASLAWTKGFDAPVVLSVDYGNIPDITAYNIHGYLTSTDGKTLPGLTVELFSRHANGNPPESIGFTTVSNTSGFFQFLVQADTLRPLFEADESIQVGFQVSNADEVLLTANDSLVWLTRQVEPVNLVIDIRETPTADIEVYSVSGEVFYANNTTRQGLQVRLYHVKFREEVLLVSGATNSKGYYTLAYSTSLFGNANIDTRNVLVKVFDNTGSTLLATSNIAIARDLQVINFEIPTSDSSPIDFANITGRITSQISGVAINTLTVEDISYLSVTMEMPASALEQVVKVHQYAAEVSTAQPENPSLMYAQAVASDTISNPVLNFRDSEVRDNIAKAIDNRIIPETDPTTITNFVNAARSLRVTDTRNLQIAGEEFVLNDALTPIFETEGDLVDFLHLYSVDDYSTAKDFWENYASEYSPELATQAKKGISLMAVTGFQPEVIEDLLGEVEGDVNIRKLAAWDEATWISRINTICTNADRLCVPIAIRRDSTDVDDTEAKTTYAKTLKTVIQDLYPLANIQAKLEGSGGADLISDAGRRADAITFLENNPTFDLRADAARDINPTDYNLTGVTDVAALKEELEPFQRLLRVSGGKPEAVAALKVDGVVSAMDITAKGITEFTADYGEILGGEDEAVLTYSRAELIDNTTTEITMDFYQSFAYNDPQAANMESNASFLPFYNPTPTDPNLIALFGNLDFCSCRDCLSLFSPSAYLTDMLRFLEKEVTDKDIFVELMRRRKDLKHIDLSCKNTNTAVPYIDLVNELLENQVVTPTPTEAANSFQTKGTASELKGYPEHIYKNSSNVYTPYTNYTTVYDSVLSAAIYPDVLPFNLALEEARTYFNHMGISRYSLMQMFRPNGITPPTNGITSDAIYTEGLNLPFAAKTIITGTHTSSASPWLFYGIAASTTTSANGLIDPAGGSTKISGVWTNILKDYLDVLINQLRITYKEFLQLLITDFLNKPVSGVRKITVVLKNPSGDENTCVLRELKLNFAVGATPEDFFEKLYRFVRLWKASGTSITNLDVVLRLIGATNITEANFKLLGRILEVAQKLNINPEYLAMWWTSVDTVRYTNFNSETLDDLPSVYDQVFRNKSVVNLPVAAFDNPSSLPPSYVGQTALIAAFCLIAEDDVFRILDFLGVNYATPVTLPILSRIFAFGAVAKSLEYSVADLLDLFYILKFKTTSPVSNLLAADHNLTSGDTVLTYLETLLSTTRYLKDSGFSLADTNYISRNIDTANQYFPDDEDIQLFYEGLRTELKKFPIYVAPIPAPPIDADLNRLTNVIYQYFAKEFNVTSAWVEAIIAPMVLPTGVAGGIVQDFIKASFVESTLNLTENATIGSFQIKDLYLKYRLIHKIKFIFNKLALKNEEFIFLYKSANTGIVNFDFSTLPVDTSATQTVIKDTFDAILRLSVWMKVRAKLSLTPDDFIALLKASKISAGGTKAQWLGLIEKNTKWGTLLTDLVGISSAASDAGILQVSYDTHFLPSDIKSPQLILTIAEIVKWCAITGLNPDSIYAALKTNLTLADAQKVLLAAKGKHEEQAWAEIAKPLRDVLREKQRNALVAYLVARPSDAVSGDKKLWRNENELYAFLLIDVQMQPCMMTSRIKQAISSVQLFIDRILLGIEYKNYGTTKLSLSPAHTKQWETWRKWYRIWEANRKVFLYPENWIEPELRDGKSVFFEELETELLQDEFTETRAEDAFRNYLLKLDAVSRLEPAGSCYDWETGILHAFGRSYGSPHYYYYRRLVDNEWTPWERMDLEIDGDHIVPIVWSRRLYIFWLTFKEKISGHPAIDTYNNPDYWTGTWSKNPWFLNNQGLPFTDTNDNNGFPLKQYHIEISLNWSEYKDGEWLKRKIGQDTAVLKTNPSLDRYLSTQIRHYNPDYFKLITKKNQLTMTEIVKSRLFLFPYLHKPEADNVLTLWVMHPEFDPGERHIFMTGFTFPDNNAEPQVIRTWMYDWNFPTPNLTYTNNMKFVLDPGYSYKGLQVDKIKGGMYMKQTYQYNNEDYNYTEPRLRSSQQDILKSIGSNGLFKIRSKSNFGDNPLENHFFYEDERNTFFVRVVELDIIATQKPTGGTTTGTGSPISGGTTSGTAVKGTPMSAAMLISKDQDITFNTANDISRDIYPALPAAAMVASSPGNNTLQSAPLTYNAPLALNNNATTTNFKNTAPYYYFQTFYHPHVNKFVKALNTFGIDGLLKLEMQIPAVGGDTMNFSGQYQPTSLVTNHGGQFVYPKNHVDFDYWGTYSLYNWELFFHTPMMIAQQLSNNQKFAEARRWYHYIFDPTCNVNDVGAPSTNNQRFWRFRPFYEEAGKQVQTLAQLLEKIYNGDYAQVTKWENNPFKPHVIARQRILAYMKNVVMKYLDNLIAWGDQLFRQDTIESINEATQLYILAANILGRKPQEIPPRGQFSPKSYAELSTAGLDKFSNAKVKLESYIAPNASTFTTSSSSVQPITQKSVFYFCVTKNDKLMAYWDTVADRLFKIRNCMSIEGQARQLPLFEPPIDPAMLVKAAAAGVDIASVLNDLSSTPSFYRFSYIAQKANEFCNDVKSLGGALLSALEKKDAEELAVLRATQEISVQEKTLVVKQGQIDEVKANIQALEHSKEVIQTRIQFYSSRQYMNAKENEHMNMLRAGIPLHLKQADKQALASTLAVIPTINLQLPFSSGPSFGGGNLSSAASAMSTKIGADIAINSIKSSMAQAVAGYDRRRDDWQFQVQVANKELQQVDKQIISSQLRLKVAEKELETQQLQIENSRAVDEYMRGKYTNEKLYSWMISQIATTYFQSYQLAYDMAKKAERCYEFELPLATKATGGYIKFGYWDSLRKGLMSAEKLQYDLRKLEVAYIENNVRELELTKNVSLAAFNPRALIDLVKTGKCTFFIPEELFDLDYPGHYLRRLKSVSITIPCIAGPYTTVSCKLTLLQNAIRSKTTTVSGDLVLGTGIAPYVATSTAQNDSGLFELNFKDERYLPFEGKGAVSEWELQIADVANGQVALFDLETISDAILHLKYTARDGGQPFQGNVITKINSQLSSFFSDNTIEKANLPRYFSLKHEYSMEWGNYVNDHILNLAWNHNDYPFYCDKKTISLKSVYVTGVLKQGVPAGTYRLRDITTPSGSGINATFGSIQTITPFAIAPGATKNFAFKVEKQDGSWVEVDIDAVFEDIYLVVFYNI